MKTVYLALGTNVGERKRNLEKAIQALKDHPLIQVKKISSLYETEPVGFLDQDKFLNQVLECEVDLSAKELIQTTQAIEKKLGRKKTFLNGPRIIDIDILLYEDIEINEADLIIPHPRMQQRAFVLVPLEELAADLVIPSVGETVSQCLKKLPSSDIAGLVKK